MCDIVRNPFDSASLMYSITGFAPQGSTHVDMGLLLTGSLSHKLDAARARGLAGYVGDGDARL